MTTEEHPDVEASFGTTDLEALTARVKQVLDIRDRKYGFPSKTYPQCFVGREAVAQLVEEGIANDEEDAVHIGNMMLNAGVFHHVLDAHPFKNEDLFYRFLSGLNLMNAWGSRSTTGCRRPTRMCMPWAMWPANTSLRIWPTLGLAS